MRYIRTKDGRILKVFCENVPFFEENDGLTYYGKNTIDFETSCWLPKDAVINQADTIEELCDGIIVEEIDNESNWFVMGINEFKTLEKEELEYELKAWRYNFFIKNDKGLIYVAKLNDKGEIENG